MPIYQYHCQTCGHEFEQKMEAEHRDMVSCHECGARATLKISPCTHQWKGGAKP